MSRMVAILVVLIVGTACGDSPSPTAPSKPPQTWTISPTSVVMREGDTVVFRITSSAIPDNYVTCVLPFSDGIAQWEVTQDLDVGAGPDTFRLSDKPKKPANGTCTVTLTTAYQSGRVTLEILENVYSSPLRVNTNIEAYIDVEK